MHPRVVIVGTVPYNVRSSSRAFDAYFHFWKKDNLAQIFSNPKKPCKGHCSTFFQITDHRILKRWFSNVDTGIVYYDRELGESWDNSEYEVGKIIKKAYKLGGKRTAFTHLARGLLWRKRFWCTDKLNEWLDEFNPECVFLAFSNDYFINEIALYVSKRYNIPMVSCIGDDYYFNWRVTLNPFYNLYMITYRSLIRKVLSVKGSAIYISDKIRDKYNKEFSMNGETVYLSSTVKRRVFSLIKQDRPVITYFGNVRIGRNQSLCDIANALGEYNADYRIEVYSNEQDESYISILKKNPFIIFGGSIPYEQVQERMSNSDITLVVEGFEKSDVDISRYSLSTKAADALASGSIILTYGSIECGIIEYMKNTGASAVCTSRTELLPTIRELFNNETLQKIYYDQAVVMTKKNHTLERSCAVAEKVFRRAMEEK